MPLGVVNLQTRPTGEDTFTEGQMRHEFHADQVAYTIQRTKYTPDFFRASTVNAELESDRQQVAALRLTPERITAGRRRYVQRVAVGELGGSQGLELLLCGGQFGFRRQGGLHRTTVLCFLLPCQAGERGDSSLSPGRGWDSSPVC
jgi:hypothetical protein